MVVYQTIIFKFFLERNDQYQLIIVPVLVRSFYSTPKFRLIEQLVQLKVADLVMWFIIFLKVLSPLVSSASFSLLSKHVLDFI